MPHLVLVPGCGGAMTRVPLAGVEVYEWIALRRVSVGGVTTVDGRWLESGHRLPLVSPVEAG